MRTLALLIILALTIRVSAEPRCQQELLPPVSADLAIRFLAETLQTDMAVMGDKWALEYAPFRRWLNENGINWQSLSKGQKYDSMGRYFAPLLTPYKDKSIGQLRAKQLKYELLHRGAKISIADVDGYAALAELSSANYKRLLTTFKKLNLKLITSEQDPLKMQIRSAVDNISFAFIHNTTGLDRRPSFPLLSARELVTMGITDKLNTLPFNSQLLKTDGNVYFFAIPYSKTGQFPSVQSQYGSTSIILSEDFAQTWGWMSPFVMHPNELLSLAQKILPDKIHNVKAFVPNEFMQAAGVGHEAIPFEAWQPVVKSLHLFDMKPADYLKLVKETLQLSLEDLATRDRQLFDRVLENIKSGKELSEIIDKYSIGQLGISSAHMNRALELKVPVAVPPNVLDIRVDMKKDYAPRGPFHMVPKGPLFDRMDNSLF